MVIERPVRGGVLVGVGLVALGLLAGCSGGGGGTPDVSFSFASSAATLLESDGPTNVTVVLHTTLPALDEDVTIEVADAATGTATSASDYAAFAPATITFLTGAVEGATQTVALDPFDDALVDGASETVRLKLQNPSRGGLAGPSQFTATLTDIHIAYVGFATNSDTPDEPDGAQAIALELDCGPGVTLGTAVSVRVSDLRTGSASSGSDYSSFAAQTITFSQSSPDGAVQTVNLTLVDDTAFEADETVALGLSQPSKACLLGTITSHVLTIQDDDSAPAEFVASEGLTGTENPLAYDEQIALGSQIVGTGPNAGTLLRVTNEGGVAMDLGTPSLLGNHPNDFAVEVESSSMPAPLGPPGSSLALSSIFSEEETEPGWSLAVPGEPGLTLRLDAPVIARMGTLKRVDLHNFSLPGLGTVTVELERRPLPLTAGAKLAIDGREIAGGVRALVGDLQIWRGVVAGMPGSCVYLALSPSGARGFFELPFLPDRFVHVLTDGSGQVRLVREEELAMLGLQPPQDFCAGERFVPGRPVLQQLVDQDAPGTAALTVSDCTVAFETDFQFFQKFGSSTALINYVTGLVGAVSDQYFTDVQTTISIAYIGFYTTAGTDPWTTQETPGATAGDLLDEFQAAWTNPAPNTRPPEAVGADLAHFLSGDSLGGGVAYVDQLCDQIFGFGVSANMTGMWNGLPGALAWDFIVVAHEIGHNFGSFHTHDYCPPLDHCYANCDGTTSCPRGTLMSYCHTCGGLANIDLYFHPMTANIMRQNVNSSCLDDAALLSGDFVQYRVRFNPLTTTGPRSATLNFTHDATNVTQPFRVRLAGTAN